MKSKGTGILTCGGIDYKVTYQCIYGKCKVSSAYTSGGDTPIITPGKGESDTFVIMGSFPHSMREHGEATLTIEDGSRFKLAISRGVIVSIVDELTLTS